MFCYYAASKNDDLKNFWMLKTNISMSTKYAAIHLVKVLFNASSEAFFVASLNKLSKLRLNNRQPLRPTDPLARFPTYFQQKCSQRVQPSQWNATVHLLAIVHGHTRNEIRANERIAVQRRYQRGRHKPCLNTQILSFLTKKFNRQKAHRARGYVKDRGQRDRDERKRDRKKTQNPCPVSRGLLQSI